MKIEEALLAFKQSSIDCDPYTDDGELAEQALALLAPLKDIDKDALREACNCLDVRGKGKASFDLVVAYKDKHQEMPQVIVEKAAQTLN